MVSDEMMGEAERFLARLAEARARGEGDEGMSERAKRMIETCEANNEPVPSWVRLMGTLRRADILAAVDGREEMGLEPWPAEVVEAWLSVALD